MIHPHMSLGALAELHVVGDKSSTRVRRMTSTHSVGVIRAPANHVPSWREHPGTWSGPWSERLFEDETRARETRGTDLH
jgi:hypothetical protein